MEKKEKRHMIEENKNAGFTLIEMLIAMLLSALIILGVSQFMVTSSNVYKGVNHQIDVQMESQDCVNAISNRILEANNVTFKDDANGSYIDIFYELKAGTDYRSVRQDIFWLDKSSNNMYLFVCDSVEDFSDAYGDSKKNKELFAEGVVSVDLLVGGSKLEDSNSYYELLVSGSKNPEIQMNIEMQSDANKSEGANTYKYTYIINSSATPRNEIVPLT